MTIPGTIPRDCCDSIQALSRVDGQQMRDGHYDFLFCPKCGQIYEAIRTLDAAGGPVVAYRRFQRSWMTAGA